MDSYGYSPAVGLGTSGKVAKAADGGPGRNGGSRIGSRSQSRTSLNPAGGRMGTAARDLKPAQ